VRLAVLLVVIALIVSACTGTVAGDADALPDVTVAGDADPVADVTATSDADATPDVTAAGDTDPPSLALAGVALDVHETPG
jgi:hypothetical protein